MEHWLWNNSLCPGRLWNLWGHCKCAPTINPHSQRPHANSNQRRDSSRSGNDEQLHASGSKTDSNANRKTNTDCYSKASCCSHAETRANTETRSHGHAQANLSGGQQ
jgi:hypothetical protein